MYSKPRDTVIGHDGKQLDFYVNELLKMDKKGALAVNWRSFARELSIENIICDLEHEGINGIPFRVLLFRLLVKWSNKKVEDATVGNLLLAFEKTMALPDNVPAKFRARGVIEREINLMSLFVGAFIVILLSVVAILIGLIYYYITGSSVSGENGQMVNGNFTWSNDSNNESNLNPTTKDSEIEKIFATSFPEYKKKMLVAKKPNIHLTISINTSADWPLPLDFDKGHLIKSVSFQGNVDLDLILYMIQQLVKVTDIVFNNTDSRLCLTNKNKSLLNVYKNLSSTATVIKLLAFSKCVEIYKLLTNSLQFPYLRAIQLDNGTFDQNNVVFIRDLLENYTSSLQILKITGVSKTEMSFFSLKNSFKELLEFTFEVQDINMSIFSQNHKSVYVQLCNFFPLLESFKTNEKISYSVFLGFLKCPNLINLTSVIYFDSIQQFRNINMHYKGKNLQHVNLTLLFESTPCPNQDRFNLLGFSEFESNVSVFEHHIFPTKTCVNGLRNHNNGPYFLNSYRSSKSKNSHLV